MSLLLAVITFAIFWPVTHHGFVNYDDDLYVLSESNAAGETTAFEYDALGNCTKRTDAAGNITAWEFDDEGYMRAFCC
jgi:YD repeat-containing protein